MGLVHEKRALMTRKRRAEGKWTDPKSLIRKDWEVPTF